MKTWFTSDHHFGHANIIKYCNRPFSDVHEMNQELAGRWNTVVGNDDTVWVIGDFSFMKPEVTQEILSSLNGIKNLVLGNHDKRNRAQYLSMGFSSVVQHWKMNLGRFPVTLHHYPKEHLDRWTIHGHTHSPERTKGKLIHVGVDAWSYAPVSEEEIIKLITETEGL